jgi:hypothetical protein
MRLNRLWLRSVPGQLTLLGVTYVGAVVLAVAALCLRSLLFEPYIRETYQTAERLGPLVRAVARGDATREQLQQLDRENAGLLYDAWLSDAELDPQGRLARRLFADHGPSIMERLRRTLVVGNAAQRARALQMLGFLAEPSLRPEALELVRYARQKAERRGETELERQAAALLARWERDQ